MSGIRLRNAIDAGCCRRVIRYDTRRTAKSQIDGSGVTAVTAGKVKARLWHVPWDLVRNVQIRHGRLTTEIRVHPSKPIAWTPPLRPPSKEGDGLFIHIEFFYLLPRLPQLGGRQLPFPWSGDRQLEEVVGTYARLANFQYSLGSGNGQDS